jgi:transcription elongation factor SPT6
MIWNFLRKFPPAVSSKCSDEDLDNSTLRQAQDIYNIWDDGQDEEEDYNSMGMDDFIDYDGEEDGGAPI